jgi:hypothetical protein
MKTADVLSAYIDRSGDEAPVDVNSVSEVSGGV